MNHLRKPSLVAVSLFLLGFAPAWAGQGDEDDALTRALHSAGIHEANGFPAADAGRAPQAMGHAASLHRALMVDPRRASHRIGSIAASFRAQLTSPWRLLTATTSLGDVRVVRGLADNPLRDAEERLLAAPDPLATGLALMLEGLGTSSSTPMPPDTALLPRPFRAELGRLLAAIGQAQRFRQRAVARFPSEVSRSMLLDQLVHGRIGLFAEPDYRQLFPLLDQEALAAGMQVLVGAVEDFEHYLKSTSVLPRLQWRTTTPLGDIVLDTTGANNEYQLETPLLLIDTGGDDRYDFRAREVPGPISVLLDTGGNDGYRAATAACPASAMMGYGILWDSGGNDRYAAADFAQAAAIFGAALLFDGGGDDHFEGRVAVQAYATGGFALLLKHGGNDEYRALGRAQAAAGARGVAVLLDGTGNDRYTLLDTPLLQPSAQLPEHNLSLGQGAASGLRADFADGISVPGGIGLLLDLEGDDRYQAEVFAQGAAYHQAVGLLVDGGGADEFTGRWYAQAAAAHDAVAVLLNQGSGNDSYRASHSTSLGAAHDDSLAVFVDEGGDDRYDLGMLGLGAAHDNSIALFVDGAGDDTYRVAPPACHAFGAARMGDWSGMVEDVPNIGIFLDLGGHDEYPAHCAGPRDDADWTAPRAHPQFSLRAESGAGIDGVHAMPIRIAPRTLGNDVATAIKAAEQRRRAWRDDPRHAVRP